MNVMLALRFLRRCGAVLAVLGFGLVSGVVVRAAPVVAGFERFHRGKADALARTEGGLLLLSELNCVACHQLPGGDGLTSRPRLSLSEAGSRLSLDSLAAFIADPHRVKPGTLMPQVALAPGEAEALAAYLGSLASPQIDPASIAGSVESGRGLYHAVGCVACHAADTSLTPSSAAGGAAVSPPSAVVPLGLAAHYDRSALVRFLMDPLSVRPAGRMPDSHLTLAEATDIAAYLQRASSPASAGEADAAASPLIEEGRRLFAARGCVACHVADDTDAAIPVSARGVPAISGLAGSPVGGCLAETRSAPAPDFQLDAVQRGALVAALQRLQEDSAFAHPEPERDVERFLARMNCYACHSRDGRGGVEPSLRHFFGLSDSSAHSIGELGNLPPALDHTGRKLTRSWLAKLLWEGGGEVRPYQIARMPAFGQAVCESVLGRWEEADRRTTPVAIDVSGQKLHQRSAYGRSLMGTQDGGLGCITCHGLRDRPATGVSAVPLDHTAQRLRPEYFKELLLDPQSVQPGTLMPPMFMGRAKADQEIEQIWTYLKEVDQQLLPEGLLRTGEYELRPEAVGQTLVFRTFLQAAGLEAVAVGSPTGRHAAFDAREVRWALTWRGRFLDALTTWEERAMTPAKALGENVTELPAWTSFMRDGSGASEAAIKYRYRGYTIGPDGVPTFRYEVEALRVEDTLRPDEKGDGYRRTVVVRGGGAGWVFRGMSPGSQPRPVSFDAAGEAVLEELLP